MRKLFSIVFFLIYSVNLTAQIKIELETYRDPNQIDIIRDKWGVPHIFGKTDADVAYGLAWAHAEDDFETIQLSLMAGNGMLARYKGREGAQVDYIVRLLRIPELVEDRYERDLSADFKKVLQGYCEGLNAYAEKHNNEVLLKNLFPVTPKAMIRYSVLQLCILSGADKALSSIFGGTVPLLENFKTQGSNAFAFNSKKTTDGNTYLAINAHQPLEGPVAFYEAHLNSEEGWNILGANFPGAPSILHGVNEHLGWAHTVNEPDKLDVYQLEMHPKNKNQYLFDGNWETLEVKETRIPVKFKLMTLSAIRDLHWSKYGPTIITKRGTFSIRMPAQMDIRGLEQWYRFNKAKNFTEFKAALEMRAIPGYNIVYADKYDTIYYISNGRIPVRPKGYNWKSTLPGNTSKTLWNELHPISALPQVLQPSSGFVYNTNHSPFHSTEGKENPVITDSTMGYETLENNRSKRWEALVQPLNKVSYEDFKRIKFDRQFPSTFYFPYNIDSLFLLDETTYPDIADLIVQLKNWDKKGDATNIGAGTFFMVYHDIVPKRSVFMKQGFIGLEDAVGILRSTKATMLQQFNRTNLQLGEVQKLVRGNVALPLPGLPDLLAPMYSIPYKDGMYKGNQGDAYIELVKFTKDGPIIESVNVYGASARKDSPHYTDQMQMYIDQKTKPMTLNKATVYQQAVKKYHPL